MRFLKSIGLPALAAIVLAWTIIPRGVPRWTTDAEYVAAAQAYERAWADARAVRELAGRETALNAARAMRITAGAMTTVEADRRLAPSAVAYARAAFEGEVRALAPAGTRYPLAFRIDIDTTMRGAVAMRSVVLPERAGEPCTVVLLISKLHMERPDVTVNQRVLGPCAFYAAYGAPGPEIAKWLRDTRAIAAAWHRPPVMVALDTGRVDLRRTRWYWGMAEMDIFSCRSGRMEACTRIAHPDQLAKFAAFRESSPERNEQLAREMPSVIPFVIGSGGFSSPLQSGLLGAMTQDLGSERFGELWRGTQTLSAGYESVAGRPLDEWVASYIAEHTTPYHAGPGVSFVQSLLALAIAAAFSAWAYLRAPRVMS